MCAPLPDGDTALESRERFIFHTMASMGSLEKLWKKIEILESENRFDGKAYSYGLRVGHLRFCLRLK